MRVPYLLITALCSLSLIAQASEEPTSSVTGLRVVSAPPIEDAPIEDVQELRPFSQNPGISLSVLVHHPQGGMISFDRDQSRVQKLSDSTGNSLVDESKHRMHRGFSMFPKFSDDGRYLLIEVNGGHLPAAASEHVELQAQLRIQRGTGEDIQSSKVVTLSEGASLKAGKFRFNVKAMGESSWGGDDFPFEIELTTKQDVSAIKDVRFASADQAIDHEVGGTSSWSSGGQKETTVTYRLAKTVEQLTMTVVAYEKVETITLPINHRVGLGLSAAE